MKVLAGQEYAAKIINTKKLSARGKVPVLPAHCQLSYSAIVLAPDLNPKLDPWETVLAG